MGTDVITVRRARPDDLAGVDAMLARTYPVLLKHDYPPSVLVTALPIIARAQPRLLASGRYFVAEDEAGMLVGAGGWSAGGPDGAAVAHIRHFVTDHRRTRQGIGRSLMAEVLGDIRRTGPTRASCLSTRTAVPFYQAMGFVPHGPLDVDLRAGIVFPCIEMSRDLRAS